MTFHLGTASMLNLVPAEGYQVHPDIIRVAIRALEISSVDGTVIPGGGVRTLAQAQDNVRRKTGKLLSLHRVQPDGYGHAIDLVAYVASLGGATYLMKYARPLAMAVRQAAAELMIPIRQGCDWDQDGTWGEAGEWDWNHFEKPKRQHLARATELMHEVRAELGLMPPANDDEAPETLRPCAQCEAVHGKLDEIRAIVSVA